MINGFIEVLDPCTLASIPVRIASDVPCSINILVVSLKIDVSLDPVVLLVNEFGSEVNGWSHTCGHDQDIGWHLLAIQEY